MKEELKADVFNLCKQYNMTTTDLATYRHLPTVKDEVIKIMESEGLEFGADLPIKHANRVVEIWFQVISEFKRQE